MQRHRPISFDVLAIAALFLILGVAFYAYFSDRMTLTSSASSTASRMPTISLKGETIRVTVATTTDAQEKGLSGREGLAQDEGMLFIFPKDGTYAFWMKDMLFSIDMIWFSSDGRVVYMVKNASPDSYPTAFAPDKPARSVLELPAGWADAHGLKIGDTAAL